MQCNEEQRKALVRLAGSPEFDVLLLIVEREHREATDRLAAGTEPYQVHRAQGEHNVTRELIGLLKAAKEMRERSGIRHPGF